ncbi:hypothetical protein Hanom_Chr03g00265221 [Helianthus anomalus]
MRIRIDPSFFLTNNTGAPHGDELGCIKTLSRSSSNCFFSFCISVGAIRYGALAIGAIPGIR